MVGNFNDIVRNEEKWGDRLKEEWSFKNFKDFIAENELVNIGFKGHPCTWSNNWDDEGEVRQCLDRGFARTRKILHIFFKIFFYFK